MPETTSPSWDALYATAELQAGYFTTAQGAEAGYSPQLLYKHLEAGRIRRARRGVYRLVHFPMSDDEHLVECWLWAEQAGVFSHETAQRPTPGAPPRGPALHGARSALNRAQ